MQWPKRAVVGKTHDVKGQAIAAFVTLREGFTASPALRDEPQEVSSPTRSARFARPDDILFSADLPKTRSGKIMRRLLRDIAEGRALGDTTTLADPGRGVGAQIASTKTRKADRFGSELHTPRRASYWER